eukprot:gnl/MRDRNA2_/MRDRNA2_71389_c0_seq1.p1 gnl/MRDRNA2_/MRDRNA2_71389_c0~~gnl/MRDRNA2_/MRDRNA2_71389_c0_seq1.p1  ORF type:complete len:577 (-),score=118.61 gnl/MRDRNA2_/MRDRNA2_71389_c0_seq1:130-1611(-)
MSPYCFATGKAVCPDEASSNRHNELDFVEFLVSLGFAAFTKFVKGDNDSEDCELFPDMLEEFFEDFIDPLSEQITQWMGSSLGSQLAGKVRGFSVSPEWLQQMANFLQGQFKYGCDDLGEELTLREFRTAMQGEQVQKTLVSLGLELPHLDAFFEEADLDGNGQLSLLEALQGFARMKERLKNDERALGFLRHLHEAYVKENVAANEKDHFKGLKKDQFILHFGTPKVLERLNGYGVYGSIVDFWEFVAPKDGLMTVDLLLAGYLKYRDPKYGGDKAVVFLRHLFEQIDTDHSGELSKREFMQILKMPKNMEKLHALGMNVAGFGDNSDVEDALLLFFYELDVDFSGSISVDEMVSGFIRCRDACRMRQLESTGLASLENTTETKKMAPYLQSLSASRPESRGDAPTPSGGSTMRSAKSQHFGKHESGTPMRSEKSQHFGKHESGQTQHFGRSDTISSKRGSDAGTGSESVKSAMRSMGKLRSEGTKSVKLNG